jgi:hypothetical protein
MFPHTLISSYLECHTHAVNIAPLETYSVNFHREFLIGFALYLEVLLLLC